MFKGAFYYFRLVRVYVTRCFWVEKEFLVTFRFLRNLRPPRGPSWPVFFSSKSRILLNLLFLLFLRYLLLGVFR